MNIEEAIKNVEVICATYKGELKEHVALQMALDLIKAKCLPDNSKQEPKNEKVTKREVKK